MVIPVWFTLGFGILAGVYGAYRIWLGVRPAKSSDEGDKGDKGDDGPPRTRTRRGMFAMAPRTHLMFGVVYILLGAALVATSFGWNPFGGLFMPRGETTLPTKLAPANKPPAPALAPAPSSTPVETVPPSGSTGSAAPQAEPPKPPSQN
jgi:hypothetical protein